MITEHRSPKGYVRSAMLLRRLLLREGPMRVGEIYDAFGGEWSLRRIKLALSFAIREGFVRRKGEHYGLRHAVIEVKGR